MNPSQLKKEVENKEFKIVHLNTRYQKKPNPLWFELNLIIQPEESWVQDWCELESQPFSSDLYICDLEQYIKLQSESPSSLSKLLKKGWKVNNGFLTKVSLPSKPDKDLNLYQFREYLQVNPITTGAFEMLESIAKGSYTWESRFSCGDQLIRLLTSLTSWWD